METYDFVMLAVVIGATIIGAYKGLAWQVASVASLVVSYFVALHYSPQLAPYLMEEEPFNRFLAMLILYAGTSVVIWMLFRLVAGFIDRLRLKEFDRQMGALLGAAKGVLLCIAITFFAVSMTDASWRDQILHSKSGYYIGYLIDRAEPVMPEEIRRVIGPHLRKLDSQLDHEHVDHGQEFRPGYQPPVPAAIDGPTAVDQTDPFAEPRTAQPPSAFGNPPPGGQFGG